MSSIRHDLLQPSLQGPQLGRAPYSQTVGFFSAFFGGPLAVLIVTGVNARRLGRWPADLRWLLPAAVVWLGLEALLQLSPAGRALVDALSPLLGKRTPELLQRTLALAYFAATALWLHRREHRMADLLGLDRPSGWTLGVVAIVAGNLLGLLAHTVIGSFGVAR